MLAIAGGAVALGGLVLMPRVLRPMAFFRVRQIELLGVRYVAPDDVLESLQLRPDQSVFDDLDVLERRASRVVGVVRARGLFQGCANISASPAVVMWGFVLGSCRAVWRLWRVVSI